MPDTQTALASKAFGNRTDPALVVAHESYREAMRFLADTLCSGSGVALIQGPSGAGKSTIARAQRDWSARESAVALLDGMRLSPQNLLGQMMTQFGITPEPGVEEQLLQQLNSFMTRETREGHAPVLIIDNFDRATASTLRLLNWFACLEAGNDAALKILFTGKDDLSVLLQQDSTRCLARRRPAIHALNPLSVDEATIYLRTRYIAAGGEKSETVFPLDVCRQLHANSRGWPGSLNDGAIGVIERIAELNTARPVPTIIVTRDGETAAEYDLTERKYIVGRSDLADIQLDDPYVSKTHALLQVYSNVILVQDLNSTNGTTVNSRVIQKTVLRNNDIISLGSYRLKLENAPALTPEVEQRIKVTDTLTLKSLDDLQRQRVRRHAMALKQR